MGNRLPTLHKHQATRKGHLECRIGKVLLSATLASEPGVALPLRTWAWQNDSGRTQYNPIFMLGRTSFMAGQRRYGGIQLVLGPLLLMAAWP